MLVLADDVGLIDRVDVGFDREMICNSCYCSWDDKDNDEIMCAIEEELYEIIFNEAGCWMECIDRCSDEIKQLIMFEKD